jgi:hypothetical protein
MRARSARHTLEIVGSRGPRLERRSGEYASRGAAVSHRRRSKLDSSQFDELIRSLTGSRRSLVSGALAVTAGWLGISGANAKKKHKHKHKKRKPKAKPNAFGCLNVGDACQSEEQCCSGICEGKKGKRKCVAHNASVCGTDTDLCTTGQLTLCNVTSPSSACVVTTGQAGFCGDFTDGGDKLCRDCRKDTDCQEEFGAGAACVSYGGICAPLCAAGINTACVPAGD